MSHDNMILIDTADNNNYVCFDCVQRRYYTGLTTVINDLRYHVFCIFGCGRSNHDSNN